ncbi:hypothetical protein KIW84_060048 [Lathyrus oleraceus]|uniref:Peptidase M48 domain-containing protein n=1 Tax=Pisum sativum TaxID=3888 RepID=A0A9D4VYK3_PEA|nr:hypothetical protein KIW84_060048 [Pisum sativum]
MVQVQFGHLWNPVEVNYEVLVQTHLEFQCQVEIEQDLVEVEDRFGLKFLVRTERTILLSSLYISAATCTPFPIAISLIIEDTCSNIFFALKPVGPSGLVLLAIQACHDLTASLVALIRSSPPSMSLLVANASDLTCQCHPGGKVIISKVMIDHFSSEAEIATFIAHEAPTMAAAGYVPRVAHKVFEKIGTLEGRDNDSMLTRFVDTHPPGRKRAEALAQPKIMKEALILYNDVRARCGLNDFIL